LKSKIIKYSILDSENKLHEIIFVEIKRKTIDKKYNLSGENSIFGGIDIYKHLHLGYSVPSTNSLIRLNLQFVGLARGDTKNILRLKRVNGKAYDVHSAIAIVLAIIMAMIASYQILNSGFKENIAYSIMPIFGIGYYLVIEVIARISFKRLSKKVEKIMDSERINFQKF